ncbi:pentapeptide repeat-containing protein [Anabaena sp. FACHB-1237]|uniref:pentapeptide repeat-containing protein n=1 Tax=Anabaena sp. FACHB-1237 TaxID=2692769 RepID=UPI00168186F6|nr:pentapeptide repeat-containing protein [Anabaena sp. FACHB-1237]MBD2136570.1 pentapeptide repeat-containing protein [Anabaena sp. FACHB-1237]
MTSQSPQNNISTDSNNENQTSASNSPVELTLTEVNESFNYIKSIHNHIKREYEIIKEAKRLDIPPDSYRRLLEAYIASNETSLFNSTLLKPVKFMDRCLGDFVQWCENISLYKLTVVLGQGTLLLAMGSYFIDGPQRKEQALNDAKKLILDSSSLEFNSQRIDAFEFLNKNCTTLVGIEAPKAYMPNLQLNKCYELKIDWQTFFQKPRLFHYQGAEIRYANLAGANLQGANLKNANLAGANLQGANLKNANLAGANLQGANLKNANLSGANLQGANLKIANLQYALMNRANFKNTDFSEANLFGSNLTWADLSKSQLYKVNLSRTLMSRVNLQGADLYGANLEYSSLTYADLRRETNLRQAKLKGTNLYNAYFSSISQLQRGLNWQQALIDKNWQQKITQQQKVPKIGVILSPSDTIFQSYLEGIKSVKGVEVITISSGPTVAEEAQTVDKFINAGVDAIIFRPEDPDDSVAAIKKAFDQGIIIINIGDCIDELVSNTGVFGCYEGDSIKMGSDATLVMLDYMKHNYPNKPINIGMVDGTRIGRVYPYYRGFKETMENSGVEWHEIASTDAIDQIDISKIKEMLTNYPQINVIWSGSDSTTSAAVTAVQELGLGRKVKVFGIMDLTAQKAKMLADPNNPLQSIIDQSPKIAGKKAAERVLEVFCRENIGYQYYLIPHRLLNNSDHKLGTDDEKPSVTGDR